MQGWLKGVNGTYLDPAKDMGGDAGVIHPTFPKDVYSFVLNYYNGDYKGIDLSASANSFASYQYSTKAQQPVGRALFNGNIAAISLALSKINNGTTTGYSYGYDQLNRLLNMRKHVDDIGTSGSWGSNSFEAQKYKETYSYDANGNIQTLSRNANVVTGDATMDNLTYWYYYMPNNGSNIYQVYNKTNPPDPNDVLYLTNRLAYVTDAVAAGKATVDIDNQNAGNYKYDNIGNLIKDQAEGINNIEWTVYGKIKSIWKSKNYNSTTVNTNITYDYDVSGNRVVKNVNGKETFYVRDAQGNVMGVYEGVRSSDPQNPQPVGYNWQEQHLYGSSRLGMFTPRDYIAKGTIANVPPNSQDLDGKRTYELSNHLGNVHVTICDIKREINGVWNAEILTTSDYYPFGMLMPDRHGYKVDGGWASGGDQVNGNTVPQSLSVDSRNINNTPSEYKASQQIEFTDGFVSGNNDDFVAFIADGSNTAAGSPNGSGGQHNSYRYGFNGKENDDEVKGEGNQQDYGMRIYDGRLGRFLSVDALTSKFPYYSPYQFAGNTPIQAIDLDGLEPDFIIGKNGKLTKPMIALFNAAFSYDKAKMHNTHWIKNNTGFNAQTQFIFIFYGPKSDRNKFADEDAWVDYWLNLTVHEHKHRDDYTMLEWPGWTIAYLIGTAYHDGKEHDKGF